MSLLDKHVAAILELRNQKKDQLLSTEELKEVSLSIGISEADWQEFMKEAEELLVLSKNQLQYESYKDAYESAEKAISLNPHLVEGFGIAAKSAYMLHFHENEDKNWSQIAENLADEALDRNPNDKNALEVLRNLRALQRQQKKKFNPTYIYVGIGAAILLVIGFIFFINNSSQKDQLAMAEEEVNMTWAQVENVLERKRNLFLQITAMYELTEAGEKIAPKPSSPEEYENLQTEFKQIQSHIKSNKNIDDSEWKTLLIQIEGAENRISTEKRKYNLAVKEYNLLARKFDKPLKKYFDSKAIQNDQ